ncbi:MAG: hypothetical protein K8R57_10490 [Verrucomicrobia bacterium]|nr:hypothetical protein [Verrucomicrobiota bacterium]
MSSRDAARLPVVISGGQETDPGDHCRPVVLVARGLGVSPVFSVPGGRSGPVNVNLSFSQDLSKNGSIATVMLLK